MEKTAAEKKRLLKEAKEQLKKLQAQLAVARKAEGLDDFIAVEVMKDQAHFEVTPRSGKPSKGEGRFFIKIAITAKKQPVFVPLSIASGKKVTGFMYHIEGTDEGIISTATVSCEGDGVTQVTIGTLLFCKIPALATATFRIQVGVRGRKGNTFRITINRINYKLDLSDARYQQYIKEIVSESVKFS